MLLAPVRSVVVQAACDMLMTAISGCSDLPAFGLASNLSPACFAPPFFAPLKALRGNYMKSFVAILAVIGIGGTCFAEAKHFRANRVDAINNIVECKGYEPGRLSTRSGNPCSDFKPPNAIAVGETFLAMGASHVIRIIIVKKSERDFK